METTQTQTHRRGLSTACALAPIIVAFAPVGVNAFADQLFVPAEFPTIQDAIVAAANGDEIIVSPGIYNESIDFLGKAIEVRSTDGPSDTTISALDTGLPAVTFFTGESTDAVLDGFTITEGTGRLDIFGARNGAGIYVEAASPTLRNLVVEGNRADYGGGLYLNDSFALVEDTLFTDNSASTGGGGVFVFAGAPTLARVEFIENIAGFNGGGMSMFSSQGLVVDALFEGNAEPDFGGGLYIDSGSPTVDRSLFYQNAASGGGGFYARASAAQFLNCRVVDNSAWTGGGIYFAKHSDDAVVANTVIAGNEDQLWGGAAVFSDGANPLITGSILIGNSTGVYSAFGCFPFFANCILWENSLRFGKGAQLYGDGVPFVEFSILEELYRFAGDGVLMDDPLFENAAGPDGLLGTLDDDYTLRAGSPAIDAGDNSKWLDELDVDLAGNPRFVDDPATPDTGRGTPPIIDLGPFEFQVEGQQLFLDSDELVGGRFATISVLGGEPGAQVLIAWGSQPGSTQMQMNGWCVNFGFQLTLDDPMRQMVAMGRFDGSGRFATTVLVPTYASGREVMMQAGQGGTCPDAVMSQMMRTVVR